LNQPLVKVTRGDLVESTHRIAVAVCDASGELRAWAGDAHLVTFMRSSAKPLQALALIESGAAEAFGLTQEEIAVTCASHSGEEVHVRAARGVLAKAGVPEAALHCGVHAPIDRVSARALAVAGQSPTEVHCNCSGKHSGMLAVCSRMGWSIDDYWRIDHPLQQLILCNVASMCGVDPASIVIGIDGCGVPVHGMPLTAMATGFARLATGQGVSPQRAVATKTIVRAMQDNPYLVAGRERFTTQLMEHGRPQVVAKSGAEAVFCLGLPELGLGMALKVLDGGSRATYPATMEVLAQLGALHPAQLERLANWHHPAVRNVLGDVIGSIAPSFVVQRA
jgi:L-asparaginase II